MSIVVKMFTKVNSKVNSNAKLLTYYCGGNGYVDVHGKAPRLTRGQ